MLTELEVKTPKQLIDGFIERDIKISDKWNLLRKFEGSLVFFEKDYEIVNIIERNYKEIFYFIEKKPEILCQQLCLFNWNNVNDVFLSEMVDLNWIKENSVLYAPNLLYISECWDRFSK